MQGCDFQQASSNQVKLGARMRRAVVTGNVASGAFKIENDIEGEEHVAIANNVH